MLLFSVLPVGEEKLTNVPLAAVAVLINDRVIAEAAVAAIKMASRLLGKHACAVMRVWAA
jgi:hypothetical protein